MQLRTTLTTVFALLLLPGNLFASTSVRVIDLLPRETDRAAIEKRIAAALRHDVILIPPPTGLLDSLRWASSTKAATSCLETSTEARALFPPDWPSSVPDDPEPLLDELLKLAQWQWDELELDAALMTLQTARTTLVCLTSLVQREQIRQLFRLEGIIYASRADSQAQDAFLDMLAVDPQQLVDDPNLSPRIREEVIQAALKLGTRPWIELDQGDLPGRVLLNGVALDQQSRCRSGRHVIQIEGTGQRTRTALVWIPSHPKRIEIDALEMFDFPPRLLVLETLREELGAGISSDATNRGLVAFLRGITPEVLLFAAHTPDGAGTVVYGFSESDGLVHADRKTIRGYIQRETVMSSDTPPDGADSLKPPAFSLAFRLGGDLAMGAGGSAWGASSTIELRRAVNEDFGIGLLGGMYAETIDGIGLHPSVLLGATVSLRLELSARVTLLPALGYGGGTGPPAHTECTVATNESSETILLCPPTGAAEAGDTTVSLFVPLRAHGPLAQLELAVRLGPSRSRWSLHAGLRAHYLAFTSVADGTATSGSGASATVAFSEDRDAVPAPVRIDMFTGLGVAF